MSYYILSNIKYLESIELKKCLIPLLSFSPLLFLIPLWFLNIVINNEIMSYVYYLFITSGISYTYYNLIKIKEKVKDSELKRSLRVNKRVKRKLSRLDTSFKRNLPN